MPRTSPKNTLPCRLLRLLGSVGSERRKPCVFLCVRTSPRKRKVRFCRPRPGIPSRWAARFSHCLAAWTTNWHLTVQIGLCNFLVLSRTDILLKSINTPYKRILQHSNHPQMKNEKISTNLSSTAKKLFSSMHYHFYSSTKLIWKYTYIKSECYITQRNLLYCLLPYALFTFPDICLS